MIDETSKSKTEKLARTSVEEGSGQAKKVFGNLSNVTTEATSLMTNSYATAAKGAQDYSNKAIEFTQTNIAAAVDFTQKLSGVKSPADFIEMSSDHSRRQFETLTEQTKELTELAQKIVLATAQPLKTDFTKAFS